MRRTPHRTGALITALLVVASTAFFGCEELPTTVAGTTPNGSAGSDGSNGGTGSNGGNGSTGSNGSSSGNRTPQPTRTTSPNATPTPKPTATPSSTAAAIPSFEEPKAETDFTKDSVKISVKIKVPAGVTVKKTQLFYDGIQIATQDTSAEAMTFATWNPNRVSPSDATVVPYGSHTLKAVVTTTEGTVQDALFTFDKPARFGSWVDYIQRGDKTPLLPVLNPPRAGLAAYTYQRRIYSFFGKNGLNAPVDSFDVLNTDMDYPQWAALETDIPWRERAAVAGTEDQVYFVGGLESGAAAPTNKVSRYVLGRSTSFAVPDLVDTSNRSAPPVPVPLADASAAVFGTYLYVVGGTATGGPDAVSAKVFRLQLDSSGRPSTQAQWERLHDLPYESGADPQTGALCGSGLVAVNGKLYLIGGKRKGVRAPYAYSDQILVLDSTSDQEWSPTSEPLPQGLAHFGCAPFANDIWIFGGETAEGVRSAGVARYSPKLDHTVDLSSGSPRLPRPRSHMGCTVVKDSQGAEYIYLVGGVEDPEPTTVNPSPLPGPVNTILRSNTL